MTNTSVKVVSAAPKRVLIVDDDAVVRMMLGRVLGDEGYEVQPAADGAEALNAAKAGAVDLVLLDLGLPPTDGWDIFTRLRKAHPLLPVVIITARFGEAKAASLAGAQALLEKPLDYPTLLRTLTRVLATPVAAFPALNPGTHPSFHAKRDQNQ